MSNNLILVVSQPNLYCMLRGCLKARLRRYILRMQFR